MNNLSPINLIEETNFANSWTKAVKFCYKYGKPVVFGDRKDPKKAKDSCQVISLTGGAINEILDRKIHPQFPFKSIKEYCNEFTREYLEEYSKKPDNQQFNYLYFERLVNYDCGREGGIIDQLAIMKSQLHEQIESGVMSNRSKVITWYPDMDLYSTASPCLSEIQVRYIGENQVDIHWHFRSRDLISAFQANVIALTECLNREVIWPNNCKIARIVDYSDSLHIYDNMQNVVKDLEFVPITEFPH